VYGGATSRARSSLIGRSAELEQLHELYRHAGGGTGAAAVVWGEAGVGKTRLLDEFALLAARQGARVGTADCFEHICPPYAPICEAFAALGLPEPFAIGGAAATSTSAIEIQKYNAYLAAAQSLRGAGSASPILVCIDDLQWADLASIEFLAFLARRLGGARVLVLASVCCDDWERDHPRAEAIDRLFHDGVARLDIKPLDDDRMQDLVVNLWPADVPVQASQVERVCALAEGKPYFAEELVSSALVAGGSLQINAAPLSIRAGVLARFEQVPQEARRVLLRAAVIGRTFDASLLARVTDRSSSDIFDALACACKAQLVNESRESPGQFAFRHAITREIIYRELLSAEMQAIHAEVAECLEQTASPDVVQVAHHWTTAGDRKRAAAAHERAGDHAVARSAYRDAAVAFARAAEAPASEDSKRYASLCEKLSRALSINGELRDACAWGTRAVGAYIASGDHRQALAFALFLARRYGDAGQPADGIATIARTLPLLEEGDGRGLRYGAHITLARLEAQRGDPDAALTRLTEAESTPGEHALEERHLFYDFRADVRATKGQLGLACADSLEAIRLARQIGSAERLSLTLNNYARFAFFAGRMDEAIAAYEEALDLTQREHLGRAAAIVTTALAFVYLLTGDLKAARRLHERSLESSGGPVMESGAASIGVRLAYLQMDDKQVADDAITDATAVAFRSGPESIGPLAGSVAAYYDAIGRRFEAGQLRSRALTLVRGANLAWWLLDQLAPSKDAAEVGKARSLLAQAAADPDHMVARAHLTLFDARVAQRAGNAAAAKTLARDAAEVFDNIGWPWERAQALEIAGRFADAGALYSRHGYTRDARRLAEARRRVRHRAAADHLTPRESEVARLAVEGRSNREIAELLSIGERTVETHIAAIFDRFDLTSRRELARVLE
jgi:DNA-binding CsgD family transcriptional regulator